MIWNFALSSYWYKGFWIELIYLEKFFANFTEKWHLVLLNDPLISYSFSIYGFLSISWIIACYQTTFLKFENYRYSCNNN